MRNKYKKFAAARADMLPIKVQVFNIFTNFKDKSTDRKTNLVRISRIYGNPNIFLIVYLLIQVQVGGAIALPIFLTFRRAWFNPV